MASPATFPAGLTYATLPSHLLAYLFARLPVRDFLAVSAVCRAWHRATASMPYWRERVAEVIKQPPDTSAESFSHSFGRPARDVYSIATLLRPWHPWYHPGSLFKCVALLTHLPLRFDVLRHIDPNLRNSLRLLAVLWAARDSTLLMISSTCRSHNLKCVSCVVEHVPLITLHRSLDRQRPTPPLLPDFFQL